MIRPVGPRVIGGYLGNFPKYSTKFPSVAPERSNELAGNKLNSPNIRVSTPPEIRLLCAQQKLSPHPRPVEVYMGRMVYGRRQFVKNPTTGKRIAREAPPSE
jgi:hypothetical protein